MEAEVDAEVGVGVKREGDALLHSQMRISGHKFSAWIAKLPF